MNKLNRNTSKQILGIKISYLRNKLFPKNLIAAMQTKFI